MKRLIGTALVFILTGISAFAWEPPQENPDHVIAGFLPIYGVHKGSYCKPSDYPEDVRKLMNVWIISFVHAYDKNGSKDADKPEAAWYGTDPDKYPDKGSLTPPKDDHVILAYEQQRWHRKRTIAGDTDYCRIKTLVDAAHENGAIALLCLGYGGDIPRINKERKKYSEEEWQFPKSVLNLVKLVGADGFDIDCEEHDTDGELHEATVKAIRKVFDEAGEKDGRKYFVTMDTAWGFQKEALKHCDMVFDQTYGGGDKYNEFVPKYIKGNQFVVGASYESKTIYPKNAFEIYSKHKVSKNDCLGCFLWKVQQDGEENRNWEGMRKYYSQIKTDKSL